MIGLLKADFRRVTKDKLLLVMGILAVVFALVNPLLYSLIFSAPEMVGDEMALEMLAPYISAKAQFFGSFSMGNNLGLICPVLLAIVLCKDFSFGTIRNKVIAGKSRSQIFLSLFITCSVILIAVMLLHAFITLGVSLLFFEYEYPAREFTASDLWYFLESLALDILMLLFVSALLSWLCSSMKNVGLSIVLYIAIAFFLVLAASIIPTVALVMETTGGNQQTIEILEFINRINPLNAVSYIGTGESYTTEDLLYLTIPSAVGALGFVGLGLLGFNKKDLK